MSLRMVLVLLAAMAVFVPVAGKALASTDKNDMLTEISVLEHDAQDLEERPEPYVNGFDEHVKRVAKGRRMGLQTRTLPELADHEKHQKPERISRTQIEAMKCEDPVNYAKEREVYCQKETQGLERLFRSKISKKRQWTNAKTMTRFCKMPTCWKSDDKIEKEWNKESEVWACKCREGHKYSFTEGKCYKKGKDITKVDDIMLECPSERVSRGNRRSPSVKRGKSGMNVRGVKSLIMHFMDRGYEVDDAKKKAEKLAHGAKTRPEIIEAALDEF